MTDYSRYANLKVDIDDGIAVLTLNRPDVLNAIASSGDGITHREMEDIWLDLADDASVNVIVVTGAGRAFSAGGNVKGMAARARTDEGWEVAVSTPRSAKRLLNNILEVPQPIVAAVNGHAMGLGSTIAVMSDVSVMSEKARIGDTHVKVGLVAGDGGALAYPLLMGPAKAKDFLMRGLVVDGREAERIGLVSYSVPEDEVMSKAMEIAHDLNGLPPLAVRWTKSSVNQMMKSQFVLVGDSAVAYEAVTMASKDHQEATLAFAEKRPPARFTGE